MNILPWLLGGVLTQQLALYFSMLSDEYALASGALSTIFSVSAMVMAVACIICMVRALSLTHTFFRNFAGGEPSGETRALRMRERSLIQFETNT